MKESRLSLSKARTPAEDYLNAPYARVLIPDAESGTYTAMIKEFPGCVTQGDTPQEALELLDVIAKGWIEAALDLGQDIPLPDANQEEYSGRFALRLPRSLHRQAAQMAEQDGTSLNQFLITAIAARVGATELFTCMTSQIERLVARAANEQSTVVRAVANATFRLQGLRFSQSSWLQKSNEPLLFLGPAASLITSGIGGEQETIDAVVERLLADSVEDKPKANNNELALA